MLIDRLAAVVLAVGLLLTGGLAQAEARELPELVLEETTALLAKDELRARIVAELDALPADALPTPPGRLTVSTTRDGQIRIEYQGAERRTERLLTSSGDATPDAELVALAAANLISRESEQLLAELEAERANTREPERNPRPVPPPRSAPSNAKSTLPRPPAPPPWQFAVHAGWWDAGIDMTSPQGLFLGLGVPWVPLLGNIGPGSLVALDSRVGYGNALSDQTSVYGELLSVWVHVRSSSYRRHTLLLLPAAGLRHAWPRRTRRNDSHSRSMVGLDLSLAVLSFDSTDGAGWHKNDHPSPWWGVAFSQVYYGCQW